ncbi:nucleoside-diphosphate-sugar epimerase [Paenibacillus forsythiae]|uniref:Nucleoside-diphosphate-sugar epimerase n=2 Tax=Paenibacillus forsythiae TaxID=365616 RepID=A0ABU3H6A9_9BACL|nr:NAD-dependent epimerase/dehydratase family protein [Paenibacillus forsythiae]MDT3426334.1 nucleoside-diphosphate-sugar epimerase [Paenibacillus forsythiae]
MKKILVLGGTRFFGKRLVERLLENVDNEVTMLTRGHAPDLWGDRLRRVHADRTHPEMLASAVGDQVWDIVYDNICYSPDEAAAACRIFKDTAKRYILTSSLSVYDPRPEILTEDRFDPAVYPPQAGGREDFSYPEGKRLAEAVFIQQAAFPVAAVRFPIVLGKDDYTKRLHFHIEHVRRVETMGIPNPEARISFIRSDEAADFLLWLGCSNVTGPVNACSQGSVTIRDLISIIEAEVGKKAIIREQTADEHMSPFGIPQSWHMDTAKAAAAGFSFLTLADWLPELVSSLNRSYDS